MAAKYNMAASSEYTMITFDISPAQTVKQYQTIVPFEK